LVGQGFRVILSGNASRFTYKRTHIVTYESSDEARAIAEEARELLGVGVVRVSAQEQGIVDLTVVVGKDFLRTL
jgi:LytR cell envelope-related transcriptional attenuator